jgi:hypothetical protein
VRPCRAGKESIASKNQPVSVHYKYAGVGFFIALYVEKLGIFNKKF